MLTMSDGRTELWQWDTGRTLSVDADCSQVHFSNKVFGRSIDVDVIDGVSIIPDILLQTDNDLNVWAFVGTAENGYTKISKTFKVNRRNKPADYVFTPPEQTTLAELVGRLDKIEESQDPDAIKNAVEDYLERNPVESPVQSVNGKTGTVELTAKDVGAISNETDPTVPSWAKQPKKPTYTAAEVGALPDTYTPPNQTAQQVGADPAGTAASAVSQHNTDAAAHNDLRLALQGLSDRINAALDSDDTTLDQMSEVVAYIKSNKALIDAITTSKVSVADIVNDLVTNVADKPLSAAQGVVIKTLIDALRNDKLDAAELTNAVNTALAQAKASGEFDGQDGATPNIQIGTVETLEAGSAATASMGGTPENPVLNLGIPQGAPGTGGGSGIAVTGATVGQTIRVAAVDDNGVPTDWEPVDLPIGGVSDVQINSASVVTDGVAAIPLANGNDTYGMVNQAKAEYYCGISIVNGKISCDFEGQGNSEEFLVLRVRNYSYSIPFLAKGFDLMVKHAMCDTGTDTSGYGKPLIWSDAERISALLRLGCTVDDNGFVKWAAQEVAE